MFTMTYNQALLIQRRQMLFYRQRIGRAGVKAIKSRTYCPVDLDPNKEIPTREINRFVPRGAEFEHLETKRRITIDPNTMAWSDAVKRGFFY